MNRIPLWLDLRDADADVALAAEHACNAILVRSPQAAPHGVDVLVAKDGELVESETGIRRGRVAAMRSAADQAAAAEEPGLVLVDRGDWTIIPLENLIAGRRDRPGSLFAAAATMDDVRTFRDTLETGVHGIAVPPSILAEADAYLRSRGARPDDAVGPNAADASESAEGRFELVPATVTAVQEAGPGDRVCVDTTSAFHPSEGLLVGSTARAFVLVHAETLESEYVAARPFRVNAGALHMYVVAPDGKTRYLSELRAGDAVLAVAADGTTRTVTVGRAKIERRPHVLVQFEVDGHSGSAMLQTAETIRLVRPDGSAVAVTELAVGEQVLVRREHAARHFGMPVEERLEER